MSAGKTNDLRNHIQQSNPAGRGTVLIGSRATGGVHCDVRRPTFWRHPMTESVFYWHIHHDVLVEALTEPIENRITFIKEHKPEHERELRLRLLRPVKGELPTEVAKAWAARVKAWAARSKAGAARVKTWAARVKAWAAHHEAGAAYHEAWAAYSKALSDHRAEIEALHALECPDCPWDGKTIFPEENE